MTSNAKRDAAAEEYINESILHTLRDEPAWHYSVIDFKAGYNYRDAEVAELRAEIKLQQRELEALSNSVNTYDKINDSLKQQVAIKDEAIEVVLKELEQIRWMGKIQLPCPDGIKGCAVYHAKFNEQSIYAREVIIRINKLLGREG